MRHQHQQKQRENSPIAPDIPFADERDANDDDGPLSPRSRRRAEYTIARLQQGMLGRARSMFGGRDESPVSTIDVSKNGITDKRPPIKSPHRTLEFFTLWAAGRHKRAATIGGPAITTTKNASASTAKSSRDTVLVDNTNRHSQSNPSTVVRNVTVQKQQHVSSVVTQRLQQRRNVDHVDAAPLPPPTSMRLRHSDSVRTATTLTTTSTTANGSSSNSSSIRTSKQRYTRNNSLDLSDLGRLSNDHQHQRRSSHHQPSLASGYASADEADDLDDANEATHNDDRHVVFVNKQLFRNGGVAHDHEHRRPIGADGVKRLIVTRGISAAANDKHSIIINNHNTTRPSESTGGRTQQRAGILQRHNSAGETAGMSAAIQQPTESGPVRSDSSEAAVAAVPENGTQLRVASTLGRPKKKLSFREPVENDSKPFVFKSDTLPRAKRFIATIERQRQQQSSAGSGGGIAIDRIDDDQLEVVIELLVCVVGWVVCGWFILSIRLCTNKSQQLSNVCC